MTSAGREAVELAASAGLLLDEWQGFWLEVALGEKADGRWAAMEVAGLVPRQNGKGSVLEALELFSLFLGDAELVLHTAHEFKTAQEAFRRLLFLVDQTDDLRKRVSRVRTSHGEEGIELLDGRRIRFVARSGGSGRGFSGDLVVLDEAFNLGSDKVAALLPTLSARKNPQVWYTSSAGMDGSDHLRAVRERGIRGDDPGLCFLEWSADSKADLMDPAARAEANPALGIRISHEFVEREYAAMSSDLRVFARERMGIWDGDALDTVIPLDKWAACHDPSSTIEGAPAFAVDVDVDHRHASVGAAWLRPDGRVHVERVDGADGTGWVVERCVELKAHKPLGFVVDPTSPAASLIPDLTKAGVKVTPIKSADFHAACGNLHDAAIEGRLAHLDQSSLNGALVAAQRRMVGDGAWVWDRRKAEADITALVAVTGAYWLATKKRPRARAVWR